MTFRISTAGLYNQGLQGLLRRQLDLARTQQQMVSGTKISRAADDPSGAAQAQRLDHAVAALEQFDRSAVKLGNRLGAQENALADAGDLLTRARELAIQANSGTLSDSDRTMIARELRQLRGDLVGIANRDDGNGRYLFSGQRNDGPPFAATSTAVSYTGDDGQNVVDVAPDLALPDTDPGSSVFLRVRSGDGEVRGRAAAGNAGTAVLQAASVADHAAWAGGALRLEFTAANAYRVVDTAGTTIATGAYADGDTITAGGVSTRLAGVPAPGDSFDIAPAPTQDVFATLASLADALDQPAATPVERARRGNAVAGALGDIASAQDHLLKIRAGTGARLSSLDASSDWRAADGIAMKANLSQLRDVDYAQAASQLSLHMTAIEAAQRTLVTVQSLSLFDKLR